MPRPRNAVPRYNIDANGRAFTKVCGRFISLGRANSPESRGRYAAVICDAAQGRIQPAGNPRTEPPAAITINELLLQFATKALLRYSKSERGCQKVVIRLLREHFGDTVASEFGPLRLRLLRDLMVAGDVSAEPKARRPWSRKTVNRQVKRVQAIFRWGVSWQLVTDSVVSSLQTLPALARGETSAAEAVPRRAVDKASIAAVRAHLKPLHRDVFDLLRLTGARPGEIIGLTAGEIDRRGKEWVCELKHHKTFHRNKVRYLIFNSAAQQILQRYMPDDPAARLFRLRRDNFGHAVKKTCLALEITPFVPHQLRHTAATVAVDKVGLEAAQSLLGHGSTAMTLHYSRASIEPAKRAANALT